MRDLPGRVAPHAQEDRADDRAVARRDGGRGRGARRREEGADVEADLAGGGVAGAHDREAVAQDGRVAAEGAGGHRDDRGDLGAVGRDGHGHEAVRAGHQFEVGRREVQGHLDGVHHEGARRREGHVDPDDVTDAVGVVAGRGRGRDSAHRDGTLVGRRGHRDVARVREEAKSAAHDVARHAGRRKRRGGR